MHITLLYLFGYHYFLSGQTIKLLLTVFNFHKKKCRICYHTIISGSGSITYERGYWLFIYYYLTILKLKCTVCEGLRFKLLPTYCCIHLFFDPMITFNIYPKNIFCIAIINHHGTVMNLIFEIVL